MICIRVTLENLGTMVMVRMVMIMVFVFQCLSWLLWAIKLLLAKSVLFLDPLSITDKIGKNWKVPFPSTSKILLML